MVGDVVASIKLNQRCCLQVEEDEPHIVLGKQASKAVRSVLGAVGLERALLP